MKTRNLEGQYAGFLTRAFGFVLDYLIIAATISIISLGTALVFRFFGIDLTSCRGVASPVSLNELICSGGRWFLAATAALLFPLYFVLFWLLAGQTIGQRVMGVQVVRLDGHHMGFRRSLVRWIFMQLCFLTLGIGFLWVLIDDRRMGWHDKAARTCVLYSWKAVERKRFLERVARRTERKGAAAGAAEEAQVAGARPGVTGG